MAEIIFSDFYRTILLCILSVCIAFLTRNATKGKRVLALLGYEAIMLMPFLWILVVGMVFTDFNDKSMIDIVLWELKWILYFTLITIFQFKEKDNCLTKRAKVDFFYSFMLPNPSIKARQFHQYNVAKSINTD